MRWTTDSARPAPTSAVQPALAAREQGSPNRLRDQPRRCRLQPPSEPPAILCKALTSAAERRRKERPTTEQAGRAAIRLTHRACHHTGDGVGAPRGRELGVGGSPHAAVPIQTASFGNGRAFAMHHNSSHADKRTRRDRGLRGSMAGGSTPPVDVHLQVALQALLQAASLGMARVGPLPSKRASLASLAARAIKNSGSAAPSGPTP